MNYYRWNEWRIQEELFESFGQYPKKQDFVRNFRTFNDTIRKELVWNRNIVFFNKLIKTGP